MFLLELSYTYSFISSNYFFFFSNFFLYIYICFKIFLFRNVSLGIILYVVSFRWITFFPNFFLYSIRWIFHSITQLDKKIKLAEASMDDRFFLISLLRSAMTLFQQALT